MEEVNMKDEKVTKVPSSGSGKLKLKVRKLEKLETTALRNGDMGG